MDITTTQGMKQALTDKLRLGFGVTPEEADDAQVMRAAALVLRDVMTERGVESRMATRREEKRKVHYLSMEFLLGRSLEKERLQPRRERRAARGDRRAGLPRGGYFRGRARRGPRQRRPRPPRRLLSGFHDHARHPAAGYSICYELGIFRQRIVDGQQVELPDNWKDIGGAWLMPKPQETEEVFLRRHGPQVLGQRTAARRARGRDECSPCPATWRSRATAPSTSTPAPVGREVPDAGGYEPVLAGANTCARAAGGDGGDHRQDPLSRGQPL